MKQKNIYVFTGLMLFSLFFGASNLTYPAFLGLYSGSNLWLAILGFILSGVTLPLLGVAAFAFSGYENPEDLALPISRKYAIGFIAILNLAIGPFFSVPRTGATSYAMGIVPFLGDQLAVKLIYGIIFFGLAFWLAVKPSKLGDYLGKYLTPALLAIIAVLVLVSFINPVSSLGTPYNADTDISSSFAGNPFVAGFIQGYGTLDALAALVFAILVIDAIKEYGVTKNITIAKMTLQSGVVAMAILALIYIFIGRIGATSQPLFTLTSGQFLFNQAAVDGGIILSQAAKSYMGIIGQAAMSAAVILACLSTATGLLASAAEFFHKYIPTLSQTAWTVIFTLISVGFYLVGLSELIKWSLPILYLLYPLTISLILLVLFKDTFGNKAIVYQWTTAFTFIAALYDFLATLASMTGLFSLPTAITNFFTTIIPLGGINMAWISFALIGLIIGLVMSKKETK